MTKKTKYKVPAAQPDQQQHNRVDIFRSVQNFDLNESMYTISNSNAFVNTAFVNSNDNIYAFNTPATSTLKREPVVGTNSIILQPSFKTSSRNVSTQRIEQKNENYISKSKYNCLKIFVIVFVVLALLAIGLALGLTLIKSGDYVIDNLCPSCQTNAFCVQNTGKKPICVCRPGYRSNSSRCEQDFCFNGYMPFSNITENSTYGVSLSSVNMSTKPSCCPTSSFSKLCCGVASVDVVGLNKRIIGGSPSRLGNWPWIVDIIQVYRLNPGDNLTIINNCSGALISDRHVLTAAHCLVDDQIPLNGEFSTYESLVRVHFGFANKSDIYKPGVLSRFERNITQIFIHEAFDSGFLRNDIAILKLDAPIERNADVDYLCLFDYELDDKIVKNQKLYVAGWGSTSMNMRQPVYPDSLQYVDLDPLPIEECYYINNFEDSSIFNTSKQICAGYKVSSGINKDTCNGDSGSPLMTRLNGQWFHYGIVSFGSQKDCGKGPAVYTRTAYYHNWILNKLAA